MDFIHRICSRNVSILFCRDELVQRLRQQRDLVPILTFDESGHIDPFSICFETLRGATRLRTGIFTRPRPVAANWKSNTADIESRDQTNSTVAIVQSSAHISEVQAKLPAV